MVLQGLVDLEAEVAKCDKKLVSVNLNLEKLLKIMSQPDYEATIPAAVQLANDEKVRSTFNVVPLHV